METARPLWRRMLASVAQTTLTLAVAGAAAGAGIAGYGALAARASQTEAPAPAPRTTVDPMKIRMEASVTLPRTFTGQFEAAQQAALGFEEGGTIASVLVREGDAVERGQPLARLDTRLLQAERTRLVAAREALAAQAELARRTNERQQALLAEGHASRQRTDETALLLAQLTASMAEVDAALATLGIRIEKTEIRAPFAGRIGARLLDEGTIASPGAGVLTLLENGAPRFRVALDPDLAARLTPGAEADIGVAGRTVRARLAELSPDLDPATRSRIAFFDVDAGSAAPPAGATGEIVLHDAQADAGAWVPLSALRQGPRGAWTLLTLAPNHDGIALVEQEAAEILHLDAGRAYVRGTFSDDTLFLPDGTHRVVPGEAVALAGAL